MATTNAATAVDPITTEIIRNAFISAADEMNATLIRSAYNAIIYEAKDCSVALLDEEKRVLGQSAGLPIFLGNLEICIQLTEDAFGADIWAPGDVWVMNDSYMTGTHLGDVTIFAPIYYNDELAGFSASRAHWLDIGAKDLPAPTDSTEIYQEGIRLGPTKVMEGWKLREDIVDILKRNTRFPAMLVGDLHAQIAVARTGERRLASILDRYGVEIVKAAREQIFAQSEALDRAAVLAIPDGHYEAEGCLDNDGVSDDPFWVRMKIEVAGDQMTVDLSESSDPARGAINCGEAQTISACRVAFKRLINPDRPVTGGTFLPLDVKVRKGSLLAAQEPAACQWYFTPLGLLIDLFVKALAPAMPEQAAAASHGDSMVNYITGLRDRTGNLFVNVDCLVGGWGAWQGSDGESCLINSVNGAINDFPIEIVESRFPLKIRRYAVRTGSSGAGKWRGGCGTIREFEIEDDDVWLSLWYERSKTPAWGLLGGKSGRPPQVELNPGTPDARTMLKVNRLELKRGDVLLCQSPGGGGYGDPRERDRALIEQDLVEGFITQDEAKAEYGYDGGAKR
ncbi:MAG: N-methylhydantoinase [Gaiellales bacterium]|jgi:N-methylhydantoinase B|nr:N-methylhydantoinase [Gaiellales bacterium]